VSRSTISTFKLFELFPNEPSARKYLEGRLWKDGVTCPECKSKERITTRRDGFYRCNACKLDFTVRTGTIFERSHVPLHKWLYAMYLLVTARKGISSLQLGKEIGITQKSAWFVLHRLREACGTELEKLQGTIEVDETFFGGEENNRHMYERIHKPRQRSEKAAVVGLRQRDGYTVAKVTESIGGLALRGLIHKHVAPGSRIVTDEAPGYKRIGSQGYTHEAVKHVAGEYVRGDAHTNSIESVWAVMKRGEHGVYHHMSKKHLGRYVDEFTFRLNQGNVARHTTERLDSFVDAIRGKRLTFARLTA
jgi:transposase-like protein